MCSKAFRICNNKGECTEIALDIFELAKNLFSATFAGGAHKAISIRSSVFFSTDIYIHFQKFQKYISRELVVPCDVQKNKLQHILLKTKTHS